MNVRRLAGKLFSGYQILKSKGQPSYSQSGEDQVMRYLMNNVLRIAKPEYLDIGTNHPFIGNNTFYFYLRGCKGVCIEPDGRFESLIRRYRSRDTLLKAGVTAGSDTEATIYVFPGEYSGWNTFSREEAQQRTKESGIKYAAEQKIPLVNVNDVISKHFPTCPNILSLDVEGLDLAILQSIDYQKFPIDVICVETITFSLTNEEKKMNDIISFVESKGYQVYADTHINTIFLRTASLKHSAP